MILLDEIARNDRVTQESLSQKAGVVPGMVNKYIKGFVKQGLIIINGNKTRNVTYSLTDIGVNRKRELLLSYIKETVSLYKNAKEGLKARLCNFKNEGISSIILYGAADTAELTFNAAEEIGIEVIGIVDSDEKKQGREFIGKVIAAPEDIGALRPDAVVISSFGFQNQIYESIKELELKGIKVRKL